ncbi:MAG TPA: hypothetical protein VGN64_19385, partial [Dyadobacter sp.]|nr:hypothetical protein [Dyadobacter sp.]
VHPETVMPFCVQDLQVLNCNNELVGSISGNHLSTRTIHLEKPVTTKHLKIRLTASRSDVPVALMEVRCYE